MKQLDGTRVIVPSEVCPTLQQRIEMGRRRSDPISRGIVFVLILAVIFTFMSM